MPNNPADTSTIDDVIAYIESPEYLRMTAYAQGESPYPLLSRSTTQPWHHDGPVQTDRGTFPLVPNCTAVVTELHPWFSNLLTGDLVCVISEINRDDYRPCDPWVDVMDQRGVVWSVPETAVRANSPELTSWELELLGFSPTVRTGTPAPEAIDPPVARDPERQRRRRRGPVTQLTTGSSFHDFRNAMDSCRSFKTYGSLKGVRFADMNSPEAGHLPAALADRFRTAWINGRVSYVVYSYSTPIAWTERGTDGLLEWVIPDVRYSATTSRHQSKIKTAAHTSSLDAVRYLGEDGSTAHYVSDDGL